MKMKDRRKYSYGDVNRGSKTITYIIIGVLLLAALTALGNL